MSVFLGFISVTVSFKDPISRLAEKDRVITATGNRWTRLRAWDVQRNQLQLIRGSLDIKISIRDRRLICEILGEMEASLKDLYFHYDFGPTNENALEVGSLGTSLATGSLSRFSHGLQVAHLDAIFAKGRVSVHYCAWPILAVFPSAWGVPTFYTASGTCISGIFTRSTFRYASASGRVMLNIR
ncbi:hypothetical protein N7495_003303 [Penicillium taxi]|uniref:uncharacterized protein n=1 Tax=Penicillium taxi TaxID=168475 RepID=UPI0025454C2C|nr:uncharacterized protein N7495_003303 [Penicillium taxi]KAJ5902775.1 hypothetical protein N7495_003303 [Penicillium taxi]